MSDNELGEMIRDARRRAGLSQRQVAEIVGADHAYISLIEKGTRRNPSAELLQRLADALALDINELLSHIGLKTSNVLPAPRIYYRRKYGVGEKEAEDIVQLVEDYLKTNRRPTA